jgi:phosphocarrier protein
VTALRTSITITHPTGLHARPAVKLTRLAKTFPATLRLRHAPDGSWVDAKTIVKVMGLKMRSGTLLELEAEGEAAEQALSELRSLVERDFDEAHG